MKRVRLHLAALALSMLYTLPAFAQEHGGSKTLPQLDVGTYPGVLFWVVVTFIALLVFMRTVGMPGVQETIAKRRELLDADLIAARKASEEAQAVVKAYEDGLLEARRKAHETVGGIVAKAAQDATEQREEQQRELTHRMVVAQQNLAQAKHDAMRETQKFVNDLVMDVVSRVMESGIGTMTAKAGK